MRVLTNKTVSFVYVGYHQLTVRCKDNGLLTLYALRVISIEFLLVISMLCKNRMVMRITDMISQYEFA